MRYHSILARLAITVVLEQIFIEAHSAVCQSNLSFPLYSKSFDSD